MSIRTFLQDGVYLTGLIIIAISLFFFGIALYHPTPNGGSEFGGMFMINHAFTAGYLVILIGSGRLRKGRNGLHHMMLFLLLFLISAYSLNIEMQVFEESVQWFYVLLFIVCFNYLLFAVFDHLSIWLRYIVCSVAGIGMVVFVYLSLYLVPLYALSGLVFFVLGISLHTFVPILLCIYTVKLMRRVNKDTKRYWRPFTVGILLPMLFVIGFVINWNQSQRQINQQFRYASTTANNNLPTWIIVAQHLPNNQLVEKILKTGIVYSVPDFESNDFFWKLPNRNWEVKRHDPLVMLAAFFSGPLNVPTEERIKILECMHDARHEALERLWSGKDLITEQVSTNIQLWPELRLSYSQLEVMVAHQSNHSSRTNAQEAIYTFHLPEGGVVTSLSLWIEGREEKGILTTKAKADSAYKTIVGVESRDPSVVHWQEGNTVSVRVFPVLAGESRKFKIGVTAPLVALENKLRYNSIHFNGPSVKQALEHTTIAYNNSVSILKVPSAFEVSPGTISKTNKPYSGDWYLECETPLLSTALFSFDNNMYAISPKQRKEEAFVPQRIYLDINRSWTQEDCENIYQLAKHKKVYISSGEAYMTRLTEDNKNAIFKKLLTNRFSLFPFYKIKEDSSALVISKSGSVSPTIDDLRGSQFLEQTNNYFALKPKVRFYNLGEHLSPYLKSLKEFSALNYDQGDEKKLQRLLTTNQFVHAAVTDNEVAIDPANITIRRTKGDTLSNAPDHLMRLFAYNHILQQCGSALLKDTPHEPAIMEEAQKAYVVSPFSSLVVLETQKDYDRFDIASSKNSLQNAALKSSGAVPEPHEWALIIVAMIVCLQARTKFRFSFFKN